MAEENKNDRYIIYSKCRSKYINDEEHISTDFGYTRLEEIYNTCVRCRAINNINCKAYYDIHKGFEKSTAINTENNIKTK